MSVRETFSALSFSAELTRSKKELQFETLHLNNHASQAMLTKTTRARKRTQAPPHSTLQHQEDSSNGSIRCKFLLLNFSTLFVHLSIFF